MKDLKWMTKECIDMLKELGIPCGNVINVKANTRAKKRYGQCKRLKSGNYVINISHVLLKDEVPDVITKGTIIHELLHTAAFYDGHTGMWKRYADIVNKKYPEYNIKRVADVKETGIKIANDDDYKYIIKCEKCGREVRFMRMCKKVENPEMYIHKNCGGKFKRHK